MDGHRSRIYACSFHPKSNHEFISGGWDGAVYCWDDRQPFATGYFCGVHMCGEGLAFNKRGTEMLSCAWQENDSIQLWDYGSRRLIDTIVPDDAPCKLFCGRLIAQTDLMVCGGSDSNIFRVVDMKLKTCALAVVICLKPMDVEVDANNMVDELTFPNQAF
ncbi:hypothetical protein EVAR_74642_1 [Eumeta japonica]|uniref:Uncharacterized protein n=1 Tax=Eumeta variegata TaxID=151549 RepID=A0A4C1WDC7_EUMVA|nr:hypothetical protein EVAR_74642_1 [Eumeta japonica]